MSCRDFGGRTVFVTDVDAPTGPKRSSPLKTVTFLALHIAPASNKARNNFLFPGLPKRTWGDDDSTEICCVLHMPVHCRFEEGFCRNAASVEAGPSQCLRRAHDNPAEAKEGSRISSGPPPITTRSKFRHQKSRYRVFSRCQYLSASFFTSCDDEHSRF